MPDQDERKNGQNAYQLYQAEQAEERERRKQRKRSENRRMEEVNLAMREMMQSRKH